MPNIETGPRVVVSVTATGGGDWQVVSTPTGFNGITSALFADNDYIHGFCRFENGVDWEEYDTDSDSVTGLLQIANVSGTVTITRPAVPFASSNGGARVAVVTGTHTLAISLGSGTMRRILREINGTWRTFTGGDATPTVADYRLFKTAGSTTITAFDNMEDGKLFVVQRGASDITIADGAGISLPGNQNLTLTASLPGAIFVEDGGVAILVSTVGPMDWDQVPNTIAATELTIASGAITPVYATHTVDTEADAASDDLVTITGTNFKAGDSLTLSAANGSRDVVIKASGGNILLPNDLDITLDDTEKTVILRFDGTNWNYVAGGNAVSPVIQNAIVATTLTIATGAVTPTRASHLVDTESAAASDDLDTITATNFKAGDVLTLAAANASRTVVIKATGGNIVHPDSVDVTLDEITKTCQLRYDGTNWNVLSSVGATSLTVADKTALEALTLAVSAPYSTIIVADADYGGAFRRTTSSIATQVTADPLHGVYVPFSGGDGTTGGFVRLIEDALYAEWFGAKGDNSTACGPAINAMITLGKAISRRAYAVRAGVFRVGETIVLDSGYQSFRGQGRGATTIRRTFLTGALFEVRNEDGASVISSTSISDFSIDATVVPTSGAQFDCERAHGLWITNIHGGNTFKGIDLLGCYEVHISEYECTFGEATYTTEYGIKVTISSAPFGSAYGGNTFFHGVKCRTTLGSSGTPGAQYGLIVEAIDGLWITDCYFGQFAEASVRINNNQTGTYLTGIKFNNCWFDHDPKNGVIIEGSTSANFAHIQFNACTWLGGTTAQYCLRVLNGCTADWVTINDSFLGNVLGDCIRIDTAGTDYIISDNIINNADIDNASGGSGIYIVDCDKLVINNNIIFGASNMENGIDLIAGDDAVVTGNMIYGVKVCINIASGYNNFVVTGNNVRGYTTSSIANAGGTTAIVKSNVGYNDTSSTSITAGTNLALGTSGDAPVAYRDWKTVQLGGWIIDNGTPTTFAAGDTFCTLPTGYRPASAVYTTVHIRDFSGNEENIPCTIQTNGVCIFDTATTINLRRISLNHSFIGA